MTLALADAILSRRLRDGLLLVRLLFTIKLYSTFWLASKIAFYHQALLHLLDRNTGYLRPAIMAEFL
jgi:hypothetical protein